MTVIVPARPARPIVVEGQTSPDITVQAGRGLPPGGTAGQALVKLSDTDFAAGWSSIKTVNGESLLGAGDLVISGGGGVSDGDKGDITVSGSGVTWTIDAGAVTLSKMADLATSTILGRATAGTGVPEALTASQVRTILNVADGATANASDASLRDRATHTGTQLAATISDFATAVAATAAVTANTAKVTNATHTGDVTGATALTIAADVVTNTKLANMATQTFKGRTTAGTGDPEDLTVAQAKTLLNLTGTNSGDQTITLTGMVTGSGTGSFATSLGSFTKAQLDAAVSDGNVLYVGDVTSNATHTGDATGATALTLATVNANVGAFGSATQVATFTVNAKGLTTAAGNTTIAIPASQVTDFSEAVDDRVAALAVAGTNMTITYNDAAGTLTFDAAGGGAGTNLSYTAATRVIASDTGTDATLPLVTSGDAGLAPASGGGTTNFLRADGTWAAPAGGGGGASQIMSWVI